MRELIDKDYDVIKKMTPRAEVIELFKSRGEDYKLRLIDDMPDEKAMGLYFHEAVSYTHLDVYKRQPKGLRA